MITVVSLKHASSRRNFLENGHVVKFYPAIYGYLVHEVFRLLFQMFNGVYRIDFVSRKRRIINEVRARKVMNSLGMRTTKVVRFSPDEHMLDEVVESDSQNMCDMERHAPLFASRCARVIGAMTRTLNERGYYFIDNRSSNWLIKNGGEIVRTDLELFRQEDTYKKFYAKCDCLSFVSSVDGDAVEREFFSGYGTRMNYSPLTSFFVKLYIRLADMVFG